MASLRILCLASLPLLLPAHRCVHDRIAARSAPAVTALLPADATPRSLASSPSFSPIRFSFVYPFPLSRTLSSAKESLIKNSLLPGAVARLSALYSLPTTTSPLFAHRNCLTAGLLGGVAVCTSYAATTYCAEGADEQLIAFDASQLGADDVYSQNGQKTTLASGAGTASTDFGVFVTAVSTSVCTSGGGSDVLAYAITCQRDTNDRPTWGRVNICPSSISLDPSQYRAQLYTLIHELTHALGFTSESFALMRDDAGLPRTPRNPYDTTVPDDRFLMTYSCPLDGSVYADYFASPSTVKFFPERGMQCAWSADAASVGVTTASFLPYKDGKTDLSDCVARFVTPSLTAASQSWMGCSSLGGTEIENDDVDCSFYGSHVEQRVLPGDLMSSYISHWPVITPHSPAFFADSGWYAVNFSAADPIGGARSETGLAQGCAYATGKCSPSNAGTPPAWSLDAAGHSSGTNIMCTQDRRAIAYTQTSTFPSALPTQYQYFSSSSTLGGSLSTADYCPVVWAYSNGLCSVVANGAMNGCASDGSCASTGETYGANSACLVSTLSVSGSGRGAGCYKITCAPDGSYALVKLAGITSPINCSVGGVVKTSGSAALGGSFTCPDPAAVCGKSRTIDIAAQLVAAASATTPTPSSSPIAAASLPAIKIAILLRISGMVPTSVSTAAQAALASALTAWLGASVSAVGVVPVFAADDAALSAARLLQIEQHPLIIDGPRLATSRAANARARERSRATGAVDGIRRAAAAALAGASFQFSVSASSARSVPLLGLSSSASWVTTAASLSAALEAALATSSSALTGSPQWASAASALGVTSSASLSSAASLDPTRPVTAVVGSISQASSTTWTGRGSPGTGTKTASSSSSSGLSTSTTTWVAIGIAAAVIGLTGLSMCVRYCSNKASAVSDSPTLAIRQTQGGGFHVGQPPRASGVYV